MKLTMDKGSRKTLGEQDFAASAEDLMKLTMDKGSRKPPGSRILLPRPKT